MCCCLLSDTLSQFVSRAVFLSSCSDSCTTPFMMTKHFVRKTVFGISAKTRQLWGSLLTGEFIDEALRPCINLQDSDDSATCMKSAIRWLIDLLGTQPSKTPRSIQPPDVSKFRNDRFLKAMKLLETVYDQSDQTSQPWLNRIGSGIVCVRSDGIPENKFIGYYEGKL
jgi:hypothetical protein